MDQHELERGIEIGDFRIESRLGAGGMGIVYRARQLSLDRVVALKILGAAMTRESDRRGFRREAQAVAKLDHPGIAGVYFIGQDRRVCYMALEFIDGRTLRQVIDRLAASRDPALSIDRAVEEGERAEVRRERSDSTNRRPTTPVGATALPVGATALPVAPAGPASITPEARRLIGSRSYIRRCCEVAIEAATALAHAHDRGVVHRDIKPENILIDRHGRVHVIDFGVARFFEDASVTNTGALVGTPLYMSPEQVTGHLAIDRRTDVYSLGMVLYELLALARPIGAPTREGVLRQIVTKAISPASWYNPSVPRDLEGVLHKATARDPDDRYPTALDLADLRRWLDGKPVTALPYRYRLDPREIKAERPAGITALSFLHFLASAFAAMAGAWAILVGVVFSQEPFQESLRRSGADEPFLRSLSFYLVLGGIAFTLASAGFLGVGLGLLAARRSARWASIAVSAALVVLALSGMGVELVRGRLTAAFGLETMLLVLAGAVIAYLSRRSARGWFQLAARLRAEHRHGLAGTGAGT